MTETQSDRQDDKCVSCGIKRRDHNYSGGAYGVCGKFVDRQGGDGLLPCPFCGSPARYDGMKCAAVCTNQIRCGVRGPMRYDRSAGIECWNTRATRDATEGALESDIKLIGTALSKGDHPGGVTQAFYRVAAALRSPSGAGAAEPEQVGEIQRQFYEWWEANQVDPAHGMITQNCALATWHGAYNKYVRGHPSLATPPVRGDRESSPDDIRKYGWMVAVHNDYRQDGALRTFWLFTKEGLAIKGEGQTDADALNQVRGALSLPVQPGAGERKLLSDYTNAEIANEHHRRAQAFLGDPHVGVTVPIRLPPHSSREGGR